MNSTKRANGKLIRNIAKLDRAYRLAGKREGRTENRLAFKLGVAARAGMGRKSRQVQSRSAARLGQLSGWEGIYHR
jgi:hypothetical protein